MSDRTAFACYIYACPEDQQAGALSVLTEGYGLDLNWGMSEGEGLSLTEAYTAEEISCGSADFIAKELIEAAPGCSFVLWEDPKYEWLGSLNAYTPELGHFTAECDANGRPVYTAAEITSMIAAAGDVDRAGLIAHIERATGGAWFADWHKEG